MSRHNATIRPTANESGLEDGPFVSVLVDTRIFPEQVVLRATYRLTGRAFVALEFAGSEQIRVVLRPISDAATEELAGMLQNELVDQRLRAEIAAETRIIREWIVAQAFVEADLGLPEASLSIGKGISRL